MTCEHVKLPGGGTAIVCSRNKRRVRCSRCSKPSTKLCDFVIHPSMGHRRAQTCDKPLCDACAVSVGSNRDHCPDHPPHKGAQLPLGGV